MSKQPSPGTPGETIDYRVADVGFLGAAEINYGRVMARNLQVVKQADAAVVEFDTEESVLRIGDLETEVNEAAAHVLSLLVQVNPVDISRTDLIPILAKRYKLSSSNTTATVRGARKWADSEDAQIDGVQLLYCDMDREKHVQFGLGNTLWLPSTLPSVHAGEQALPSLNLKSAVVKPYAPGIVEPAARPLREGVKKPHAKDGPMPDIMLELSAAVLINGTDAVVSRVARLVLNTGGRLLNQDELSEVADFDLEPLQGALKSVLCTREYKVGDYATIDRFTQISTIINDKFREKAR